MREEGFRQGIADYPGIKLVSTLYCQGDSEKAMKVTENMLTANEDLAGIFACNEPGAIGAAQVLKQRGLAGEVKLVAFDAADAEIDALKEGVIQALIVQNPYKMGYEGVKAAIDAIEGREVDDIDTGVVVVTQDNLEEEEIQNLLYPEIEE
jgi:ribose transport system substrate-binding protein